MKERPIIFNSEMVRAVMEGRKVQTRRIMKVQPVSPELELSRIIESTRRIEDGKFFWREPDSFVNNRRSVLFSCPFGAVGDRLWVRETFQGPLFDAVNIDAYLREPEPFEKPEYCKYAADGGPRPEYFDADENLRYGWRSSTSMPRWASRITLEITGVRVERLQDISEADAAAEGIIPAAGGVEKGWEHRFNFRELWMGIYGEESWQANPWVWVIEFKRVEGE